MARIGFQGGGRKKPVKPSHARVKHTTKVKKGRKPRKGRKLKTTTHARVKHAKAFSEQAGAGSIGSTSGSGGSTAAQPFGGVGSTAGASARAVEELTGLAPHATLDGLEGALLDLVGEGRLSAAHALAAWTHEQDRLANQAWRRPGGLQRMGGL